MRKEECRKKIYAKHYTNGKKFTHVVKHLLAWLKKVKTGQDFSVRKRRQYSRGEKNEYMHQRQ